MANQGELISAQNTNQKKRLKDGWFSSHKSKTFGGTLFPSRPVYSFNYDTTQEISGTKMSAMRDARNIC